MTVTIRFLARLPIISFSESAIHRSKGLQSEHRNIRKMDLRIAAIALEHQATVITRNARDFQNVPNLAIEDWSK